jgi:hypothetical protein
MLIVYLVIRDNKCRMVVPDKTEDVDVITDLACQSVKDSWKLISMYDPRPLMEETNFYQAHHNYIIADEVAFKSLGGHFREVGEVLPIDCSEVHCPGGELRLINILECHNCLDHDQTKWVIDGAVIESPVFRRDRLPVHVPLFKIPETCATAIYTIVNTGLPDYASFKSKVEDSNLKGLVFIEIWRSE